MLFVNTDRFLSSDGILNIPNKKIGKSLDLEPATGKYILPPSYIFSNDVIIKE